MKITAFIILYILYVEELVIQVRCFDPVVQVSACFLNAIWVTVTNVVPAYVNLNNCTPQPYVANNVVFSTAFSCSEALPGQLEVFTVYVQQAFTYNPTTDKTFECYCNGLSGICAPASTTTSTPTTTTTTVTTTTPGSTPSVGLATFKVTPRAIMTLTDANDNPLSLAYIGDPVKLKVNLESSYIPSFDIIGWTCEANAHTVIDMGCSIVPYFPTFTRPSQGHLTSSFGLFKHISSNFISFHCMLKACAGECINTISYKTSHGGKDSTKQDTIKDITSDSQLTCPANMNEVAWGRRKRDAMDIIDKETIATIEASVYVRIRLPNNGVSGITDRHCKTRVILRTLIVLLFVYTRIT